MVNLTDTGGNVEEDEEEEEKEEEWLTPQI